MTVNNIPQVLPRVVIEHNHGEWVLENAERRSYEYDSFGRRYTGTVLVGTCVGGGSTSRLFHATSYRAEPVGVEKQVDIYGKEPRRQQDGSWYVNLQFCG